MHIGLAPMDGITDCAYRIICKQHFQKYKKDGDTLMLWTEFMSADGYMHNPPGVIKHLMKTDYDYETIAQIFGGNEETLVACAQDIDKQYDFAGIELNMGCPSPKIMKCAAGSGMLKDKQKTLGILQAIHKHISAPFSLKTRVGLTQDDVDEQFDFLVEASKYVRCIGIHGRRYNQGHSGDVDRDFIYRLKQRLPDKVIIGNGGIRSYDQALERTQSLDGVMIAQSAIGNPWVLTPHTPTRDQRYTLILEHLHLSIAAELYFNDQKEQLATTHRLIQPSYDELTQTATAIATDASTLPYEPHSVIEFRKYLFNYISGLPHAKTIKKSIAKARTYDTLHHVLTHDVREIIDSIETDTV